ncbi:hypothetical protein AGMMS49944_28530 [Spirochaetia bacterium]|nr:hypothetical protein AGMMS49944_28530 [Spirochaetia bacterium]
MKEDLTEIVAILDKSGSMNRLTDDTIGGYNAFIEEQKSLPGEAVLTTVLFNNGYTVLHRRIDIKEVPEITRKEYTAGGSTALLDALGKTINEIGAKLADTAEENRPSKVIFFIITDGEENSSKEFFQERIKEMVELQTHTYSWEFIFLGANIDSFSTAATLGIQSDHAYNWTATGQGHRNAYRAASKVMRSRRLKEYLDADEIRKELENTNEGAEK